MGSREAAICRELTKLHEEVIRMSLAELAAGAGELETRGEFVLVIGPPPRDADVMTSDALDDLLREQLRTLSVKDAVMDAVELSGRPRREVYARALALAKESQKESQARDTDGQD
jgi:16S rRNA (cytidine1402-2'-O)-methyltransferase